MHNTSMTDIADTCHIWHPGNFLSLPFTDED